MTHILIIGGSDAGISAALRAREWDSSTDVTLVLRDDYPNFSICGLPYFLSGEVPDWHRLAHRTRAELEAAGITLLGGTTATRLDPAGHRVEVQDDAGARTLRYDRLVIATGAEPVRPPLPGLDAPGVFLLHHMGQGLALADYLERRRPARAVVIGAGYIGCEMVDALSRRGLQVTVMEQAPAVLPTVDPALGQILGRRMAERGVEVLCGTPVARIEQRPSLVVVTRDGQEREADLVLVAAGVRPATTLARQAGMRLGVLGAIPVTPTMATDLPDVWAAGDCVETRHALLSTPTYLPLGTTAHKQGRVAGENAAGGERVFAGSVGTQAVLVFDLVAARTGLRDAEAARAGWNPRTSELTSWDHKVYYPGAEPLVIRLTGDERTGRLLGLQLLGHRSGEVAKRVDIAAVALQQALSVDALCDLDLSYTPPLGSPWDPVQMAAQDWSARRRM